MKRLILVAALLGVGCATAGIKTVNDGRAYWMDAAHAEYVCEEAIKATKRDTDYHPDPSYDGIGFESITYFALDRTWHTVRAVPHETASGDEAYSFTAGWRGTAIVKGGTRQKRINKRLGELLAQETPVD